MSTMRNMGFICPVCGKNHCVANPAEDTKGYEGEWFCFNCKSTGHFAIVWDVTDSPNLPTDGPASDTDSES